jgi:hypothetical protein
MSNIKLFEKFVAEEEDSNIYKAQEMALGSAEGMDSDYSLAENPKLIKEIYKTWVNNYVIPMSGFALHEEDPGLRSLISSAKAWLSKPSGVMMFNSDAIEKQEFTKENLVNYTNGEIVYFMYWERRYVKEERADFPLLASMYDLIKGNPA